MSGSRRNVCVDIFTEIIEPQNVNIIIVNVTDFSTEIMYLESTNSIIDIIIYLHHPKYQHALIKNLF